MDSGFKSLDKKDSHDVIEILLTIVRVVIVIISAGIIAIVIRRLYRELKKELIDMFRIVQYANLIMHFLFVQLAFILAIALPNTSLYSIKYLYLFDVNTYCFEMINQITWLTLIMHLKYYK